MCWSRKKTNEVFGERAVDFVERAVRQRLSEIDALISAPMIGVSLSTPMVS